MPRASTLTLALISTHAPLARRDIINVDGSGYTINFYSRASREARRVNKRIKPSATKFLLTRLSRGATIVPNGTNPAIAISTHAPLARRDIRFHNDDKNSFLFLLPRLARGA